MSVTVTLALKDDGGSPIDNVIARVFDDSDSFLFSVTTDGAGEASFQLDGVPDPGLSYIVRWKNVDGMLMQGGRTQVIRVHEPVVPPATNTFDFVLEELADPESDEDTMCLLFGYLADVSKQPIKGGTLVFLPRLFEPEAKLSGFAFPTQPAIVDGMMLVNEVRAVTNDDGYLEVKLPRTTIFDVHLYGLETPGVQIYAQIYIPDELSGRLEDVLLPYIQTVDTTSDTVALAEGETTDLEITITGSNGQVLTACQSALLEFTSDDEDVATVEFNDEGNLRIAAGVAGTANITVDRVPDTWAPRAPGVANLTVTPSTTIVVTVT